MVAVARLAERRRGHAARRVATVVAAGTACQAIQAAVRWTARAMPRAATQAPRATAEEEEAWVARHPLLSRSLCPHCARPLHSECLVWWASAQRRRLLSR